MLMNSIMKSYRNFVSPTGSVMPIVAATGIRKAANTSSYRPDRNAGKASTSCTQNGLRSAAWQHWLESERLVMIESNNMGPG